MAKKGVLRVKATEGPDRCPVERPPSMGVVFAGRASRPVRSWKNTKRKTTGLPKGHAPLAVRAGGTWKARMRTFSGTMKGKLKFARPDFYNVIE